jgi:hypothetical protein
MLLAHEEVPMPDMNNPISGSGGVIQTDVHWLAIAVCVVAAIVIGSIWYRVFGSAWMAIAHPGKKMTDMQGGGVGYLVVTLAALVSSYIMALLVVSLDARNAGEGLLIGVLVGLGFTVAAFVGNYTFAGRPLKLFLIDAGCYLLTYAAMGAILGAWR